MLVQRLGDWSEVTHNRKPAPSGIDVAALPTDGVVALAAFATVQIALQGDR